MPVAGLLRKHNIAQDTVYRWKVKSGGMDLSEARRLNGMKF
jgi:putative transposase